MQYDMFYPHLFSETPACLWASEGLPHKVLTAIGYGQTQFGESLHT